MKEDRLKLTPADRRALDQLVVLVDTAMNALVVVKQQLADFREEVGP